MDHAYVPVAVVEELLWVEVARTEVGALMSGVGGSGLTVTLRVLLDAQPPLVTVSVSPTGRSEERRVGIDELVVEPTIVPLVMDHAYVPVAVVEALLPVELAQTEVAALMAGV